MIKATSTIVEEEVLKGVKLHLRYNSSVYRKSTFFVGIAALLIATLIFLQGDPDVGTAAVGGVGIFLLLSPFWTRWFFLRSFKKSFRQLPNLGKEILWNFDEENLSGQGDGFEFRTTWANMHEAIITSQGFLIYPQKGVFHWIPATAFDNPTAFTEVGKVIKQSVKNVREG